MFRQRLTAGLALLLLVAPTFAFVPVYAVAGLVNRSLLIGDSKASAVTTYEFQFDLTLGGSLGSIRYEFCANNPLPFQPCTVPSGLDISSATLTSQTGETGFIIDPLSTANDLLLSRIPSAATPQTVTYDFSGVVNPDTGPATYYVRVLTYASLNGTGPTTEEAGLAFAITTDFSVTAYVPPYLLFCVGITISSHNCATASGDSINFGTLSSASPKFATSQMAGSTNGVGGIAISVIGTTMTSGINTIDALTTRGPSIAGFNQFGINLRDNVAPNVGINPNGPGTILAVGNYNVPDEFVFNSGDQIANSPLSTEFNTLTASYIVNIDANQDPGVYTSTITYVATATF